MSELLNLKTGKRKRSAFEPKGFAGTIYVMLHDIVLVLAAITFVFVFFARLVGVSGSSMYSTLVGGNEYDGSMGDYLILESNVLKHTYSYGDVVVACVPTFEDGKPIVKRVIAAGGQTIRFNRCDDGAIHVFVDDVMLEEEDYINGPMQERGAGIDGYSVTVPEGYYFLMGDNRNNSSDSRFAGIGLVDERYIVCCAKWILIPGQDSENGQGRDWSRFGAIRQ